MASKEEINKEQAEFDRRMEEQMKKDITEVHVDGLVLLKIISDSMDKLPTPTTGVLVGVNVDNRLEITNCFSLPEKQPVDLDNQSENVEIVPEEEEDYQVDVLQRFRDLNIDPNTVGWYQSSLNEEYINITTIETQYSYQVEFGQRCVCLVFDPSRSQRGKLEVKAVRLSDKFLQLVKESFTPKTAKEAEEVLFNQGLPLTLEGVSINQEALAKLNITSQQIFEELPVKVKNLALVDAFLFDMEEQIDDIDATDFDALDLASNPFLEKSLENLYERSEELNKEHNKIRYYLLKVAQQKYNMSKKKEKSEETEAALKQISQPDRRDSLILSQQINNYCQIVNQYASAGLEKLYLAEAVLKK